jgi:hypothetical protein
MVAEAKCKIVESVFGALLEAEADDSLDGVCLLKGGSCRKIEIVQQDRTAVVGISRRGDLKDLAIAMFTLSGEPELLRSWAECETVSVELANQLIPATLVAHDKKWAVVVMDEAPGLIDELPSGPLCFVVPCNLIAPADPVPNEIPEDIGALVPTSA